MPGEGGQAPARARDGERAAEAEWATRAAQATGVCRRRGLWGEEAAAAADASARRVLGRRRGPRDGRRGPPSGRDREGRRGWRRGGAWWRGRHLGEFDFLKGLKNEEVSETGREMATLGKVWEPEGEGKWAL